MLFGWCSSPSGIVVRSGKRSPKVADKLGPTPGTVRKWVRRFEVDHGRRAGVRTDERQRLRVLELENRELRRANEILKTASAFFAAELDGPRR